MSDCFRHVRDKETEYLKSVIEIGSVSDVSSDEEDNVTEETIETAGEEGETTDTAGEEGETTDTAGEEGETTDTAGEEGQTTDIADETDISWNLRINTYIFPT